MPQDKDDKSPEEGGTLYTASLKTGPSAPVQSSTTTSSADTSEDDLHHDSDIARSSGGGGGGTTSTSPAEVEEAQATSRKKRKHDHGDRFSFREPFLYKLRLMLDNETNAESGSIRWLDNEDAFVILDQNKFEKDIIPKYFTPIMFQSFLRKCYRWGFKRVTSTHGYKFASATFKRNPTPSLSRVAVAAANLSAGQVPFPIAPPTLQGYNMHQQPASMVQPNQLYLSLLAQLQQQQQQQNMEPGFTTQGNGLNTALLNAYGQQSLSQVLQMQQQQMIMSQIQNQAGSNLQHLFAQPQLSSQNMSQAIGSLGVSSNNPLSRLAQDQLLQTHNIARPAPDQVVMSLFSTPNPNASPPVVNGSTSNNQNQDRSNKRPLPPS